MDTKITFEFPFTDAEGKGCANLIRVVTIDGNPWFVANEVCRATGSYLRADGRVNVHPATASMREDEKKRMAYLEAKRIGLKDLASRPFGLILISESGLYKLIMRSDKPQARAFQDWVTREVLPRIRKDGAYVMGEEKHGSVEDTVKAMYRAMQEKVKRLRAEADAKSKEAQDIRDKADILTSAMAVLCEDMAEAA